MALHLLLTLAAGACLPVEGDHILMRDLAAAIPAFSAADASQKIGFTPVPGAKRRFSAGELARLAASHDIDASPQPVCFERKLEPLTTERLLATLREAAPAETQVELVDFSRVNVPQGRLEFPRDSLAPASSPRDPVIWRGRLKYSAAQSMPVWVKARVWIARPGVVAARDLAIGKPIEAADIQMQNIESSPFAEAPAATLEEVAGLAPRRLIHAGQPIPRSALDAAADVVRGETVGVEARYGAAFLKFEARAEASGRIGEFVPVRNPDSGKTFRARVARKGWVTVE